MAFRVGELGAVGAELYVGGVGQDPVGGYGWLFGEVDEVVGLVEPWNRCAWDCRGGERQDSQ